jgi:hypothetical protein
VLLSQLGWRTLQIAIIAGISYGVHINTPQASPVAIGFMGMITAALATGILSSLFRAIRFTLGRSTVEDRIWRETKTPRSPLAAAHEVAELRRLARRARR